VANPRITASVSVVSPVATASTLGASTETTIASTARIAASLSVVNPVAAVSTLGPIDGPTPTLYLQIPIADVYAVEIVSSIVLDYRGLNPTFKDIFVVADISSFDFAKGFEESFTTSDAVFKKFAQKGILEYQNAIELKTFELARTINETVDVTDDFFGEQNTDDDQTMLLSKSLPKEHQFAADREELEFGKNAYDSATTTDELQPFTIGKRLDDAAYSVEELKYTYNKPLSDSVTATDDFFGEQNADDDQTTLVGKYSTDSVSNSDISFNEAGKNVTEGLASSDQLQPFTLGKSIEDTAYPIENLAYDFVRAPITDSFEQTDEAYLGFAAEPYTEQLYHADGTGFWDNYVERGYMVPRYAGTWIPEFDVHKLRTDTAVVGESLTYSMTYKRTFSDSFDAQDDNVIVIEKPFTENKSVADIATVAMTFRRTFNDTADATDDFDGDLTTDDNQTMRFAKGTSDFSNTSESLSYTMAYKRSLADSSATSENHTFATIKLLNDISSTSISVATAVQKALDDSSSAADQTSTFVLKNLSDQATFSDIISTYNVKRLDDTFSTQDGISKFDLSKAVTDSVTATDDFDGAATAEDDQTILFVTSRTDVFSVGDFSDQQAGKNLTDEVSASDSGSLRKTDFSDITYFAEVYTGTSATF
jgi:hypothetical protein